MNNLIIDSHSHIGNDFFQGKSTIDEYIDFARHNGINVGILMPVPLPCLDDSKFPCMHWKFDGTNIHYFGNINPYREINENLNKLLIQKSSEDLQLLFVPLFHPVLDDIAQFEKMLINVNPVAIKIHGIGSGVGPEHITQEYIRLFKQYEIPIIVHTDCDFGNGSRSMQYIRNIKRAKLWAEFFEKNKIKGILNHGASLDIETLEMVNNSDYLVVALGPDKVACIDNNRLFYDCNGDYRRYLAFLQKHLNKSKLVYDADYNWNLINGIEDYDSVKRVEEIFEDRKIIQDVLANNILEFNPRILTRVRRK